MTEPNNTTPPESPEQPAKPHSNGRHDVFTHRIVVLSLGLTVLFTALDMTILQAMGKESPPALVNLGAVAIGALSMTLSTIMRPK